MRRIFLVPAVLTLAACGRSADLPTPTGASADEAKALDEAADMVEAGRPAVPTASAPAAPLPPTPASQAQQ